LYEIGLKGEYFENRLLATLSMYDLTNNNVIINANDPGNPDLLEQRGEERSTGIEVELAGRITANLSIQANYAYNHARITESNNDEEIGLDKEQAPRHSSGSWIKYSFPDGRFTGFSISLGHSHLSSRRTFDKFSNGTWLRIPSYTIFNGALNYSVDRFKISFNLNNITDKTYWEGAYGFQRNFVGAPRNYMLSVGYSF
jgi:iron complex outermembrane receptor protein